ncbi:MAG: T9SS type A sorting domain-containing protein [Crocinitomix sp.]|nr:T9SS type A sorting domain-containing protein [Crocinitomix sp.]
MSKPNVALFFHVKIVLLGLLFISQNAIAQEFEWVKTAVESSSNPWAIATDDAGNTYSTGRFVGTLDFDPGPDEFNITAIGADVYIQKLDTEGNFIWAKSIYGYGSDDQARSIDVSPDGNEVYISGFIQDSADFDPGIDTYIIHGTGYTWDIFTLKLDGDGNFEWANNIPITGDAGLNSAVRRDDDGNVLFIGTFSDVQDFDPDPWILATYTLWAETGFAMFIQKLDSDGNFIWAKKISNARPGDACFTDDLALLITGNFFGEVDFDSGPDEFLLDSGEPTSAFVLKINAVGEFVWAKPFLGEELTKGQSINRDIEGNILCSGIYKSSTDFDPGPDVFELTSNGSYDHFFMKLNESGELLWANSIGGPGFDWIGGINCNSDNEIYIAGRFLSDEIDLDPGIGEVIASNHGESDFYIEKFDEDGNLIWWKQSNSTDISSINSFSVDPEDQLYFLGHFGNTLDFDFCPSSVHELEGGGGSQTYILKLSYCQVIGDTLVVEQCDSYTSSSGTNYSETGIYSETLESVCNCDSLVTIDVTIAPIDNGVTQVGPELTSDEDHIEATYQWVNCETDYSVISGETDQVFLAEEDGEYAVIITVGTCIDTSSCYTIYGLGIDSSLLKMNAQAFPNPTSGAFNIQLGKTYQTIDITVRNIAGEIISQSTHNAVRTIPMEIEQAKGIYFLEIKTDSGEQAFLKVVRQ